MKLTEFIKILKRIHDENGDIDVYFEDTYWCEDVQEENINIEGKDLYLTIPPQEE